MSKTSTATAPQDPQKTFLLWVLESYGKDVFEACEQIIATKYAADPANAPMDAVLFEALDKAFPELLQEGEMTAEANFCSD